MRCVKRDTSNSTLRDGPGAWVTILNMFAKKVESEEKQWKPTVFLRESLQC